MYREGPIMANTAFVKTGVLDDAVEFESTLPRVEVYICNRPPWVQQISNAQQIDGQPAI